MTDNDTNETTDTFESQIRKAIMADPDNQTYTSRGIEPLFSAPERAKILLVGQAPGLKTQEAGIVWQDRSGDRLRDWLGVDTQTFYDSGQFAILPMDFYYPGKGKSGDLPPRSGFADKWHPLILENLPQIQLTILIGSYAQNYYLDAPQKTLTETVRHYRDYLPQYFPLVHPSPRNQIWMAKNPWYKEEVLPDLQARVADLLENDSLI